MSERINEKLAIAQEEGEILKQMIRENKPGIILEVGTGHGYSTHCMSDALGNSGVIYSIDNDAKSILYNLGQNVVLSNMTVESFIEKFPKDKKVNILFLDSNHQIDLIVGDIEKLLPILHKDAIVIVHDTNYLPEMGICLSDYFNGINSERLKNVEVKPSQENWIYESKNTEFGLGIAKRGEK